MLKILMCMWKVVLSKTFWHFLLTSSMLEKVLLSELSGMQFQDMVFQSSDCSYKGCISLLSGISCSFQG